MRKNITILLYVLAVLILFAYSSMFIVDQRQNAIIFRLGEVMSVIKQPGLYVKVPLLDNVRFFDVRVLTIDTPEPQLFLTSEKKNVQVDLFVKWRISDVRQYYASIVGGGGGEDGGDTVWCEVEIRSLRHIGRQKSEARGGNVGECAGPAVGCNESI